MISTASGVRITDSNDALVERLLDFDHIDVARSVDEQHIDETYFVAVPGDAHVVERLDALRVQEQDDLQDSFPGFLLPVVVEKRRDLLLDRSGDGHRRERCARPDQVVDVRGLKQRVIACLIPSLEDVSV